MSFLSIGDIIKLYEMAERVYKNCLFSSYFCALQHTDPEIGRDCSGEYKALTVETRSLSNLLGDIQDKYDKIPGNRQQQLLDAYEPCIEVLGELDKVLLRYNKLDTKSKRTWDRITYDPDRTRTMRERLTASVTMLTSFYTSLVHDNQYLILSALERLEQDYRGGHREESIASIEQLTSGTREVEDQIEDQAWFQVLRDLEDVGISQQQALSYRGVIVDWLVLAVNEGRLLEERPEQDAASSVSPNTDASPRESNLDSISHSPDISANTPPTETRSLTPLPESSSTPSPTTPQLRVGSAPFIDALQQSPRSTPDAPSQAPLVIPQSMSVPPWSSHGQEDETTIDLEWNAHQIMEAWARNDFVAAEKHLGQQLAAVEHGQTCTSGTQPDRRILRHLLGVCASLTGKFTEAKRLFESVFNGIFLHHGNLDDGDIAAARWLGDVCLHTQEYNNTILAYSVAYEGSINRFGVTHDWTQRVAAEIKLMDSRQGEFSHVERSLSLKKEPTTIFTSTNIKEKDSLMLSVKSRLFGTANSASRNSRSPTLGGLQANTAPRENYEFKISAGFLLAPLISITTLNIGLVNQMST
ncbi:hypothetical protein TW65_06247 [Stemphylium lycopersici]|nr:hypothetical protein TW65_06247 [Stemphylium lycopersici]